MDPSWQSYFSVGYLWRSTIWREGPLRHQSPKDDELVSSTQIALPKWVGGPFWKSILDIGF